MINTQPPRFGADNTTPRNLLRVGGLTLLSLGGLLLVIGMWSFFSAFGGFEPPRYFWCAFLGLPMMPIGGAMTMLGFLGSIQRYVAGEVLPTQVDAVNYVGRETQPGVKAMAEAVTDGVLDSLQKHAVPPTDREST